MAANLMSFLSMNFLWYYPRNTNKDKCSTKIPGIDWFNFFMSMNQTKDINWHWNFNISDFFQTAYYSILTSPKLASDSVYTQNLFQYFYATSNRSLTLVRNFNFFSRVSSS